MNNNILAIYARRGPHKYYFTALFCKPLVATLVHLALLALAAFITSLGGTGFRHEPPAALPAGAPPSSLSSPMWRLPC